MDEGVLQNMNDIVIYVGASFDILHAGHMAFFLRIKELFPESEIVVALNTDEFIKEFKGLSPIFSYEERKEQLLMCGYVDEVVTNEFGKDSKPTILSVHPDIVVVGTDWLERDYCKQMSFDARWLEEHNISLVYIVNPRIISTTEIKRRLNAE